ncbi:peptidoglycan-binding domain-containing protein [Kitasatospora sp. GP82]|uniref:peptidoglycan-binding domain-containing protein n=1 Tax=Kitasatospora sp. GP82 TaxID=3035089 RepID=UPI00247660DC|nr:peptidoglycan-binding domain-containing protein [Kitasatospora sp. GP82]MDH6125273.1 peptidoglycan hydrolase-like protein with peptidoglycan-binding domain [Kitasatospora sp. GP82]
MTAVQEALVDHGYGDRLDPWGADGAFGPATAEAVRAFQGDQEIEVDGVVGQVAWDRLTAGVPGPA